MAKKKNSLLKNVITGIFCFIIAAIVSCVGTILFSLPDSYKIPEKVSGNSSISSGLINSSVIENSDLSIHFLELGNKYTGDCVLIKVGDTQILVDGGSKASSVPHITNYVDNYFDEGDNVLDYVIITHAHEDHYAGFATNSHTESLFDHYRTNGKSIGTIITFSNTNKDSSNKMFSNYQRELGEAIISGAKHYTSLECINQSKAGAQKTYDLGNGVELNFLYQKFYEEKSTTENNYSVCFEIKQGKDKSYLFTGDLEKEGELSLISAESENHLGEVELYKAGHHGSKTSSCPELLEVIQPKMVVVTCVAGSSEYTSKNENQFPTQEFINNVSIYTNQIYVTSLCINYSANQFTSFNGTIVVCSNPTSKSQVLCSNNTTILKDTEWFKNNRKLPANAVA